MGHQLQAYYAWQAKLMQKAAIALGFAEDAALFDALFAKVRAAFNEAYVAAAGRVAGDTQTGYLLALFVGLLPEQQDKAVARLVSDIESRGVRLTTGFIGVRHLCPILTEHGARGLIGSHWRVEGEDFLYECAIPATTTATLELPFGDTAQVEIDGATVEACVAPAQTRAGRTALGLGSGRYQIRITGAPAAAPRHPPQDSPASV